MKKLLIIGFILAGLAWGLYLVGKSDKVKTGVSNVKALTSRVDMALTIIDKIEEYAVVNTSEIDRILKQQQKESDRKIDSLMTLVVSYTSVITDLQGQIAALPTYELPALSDVEPEDYEECLQELQGSRQAAEELVVIVGVQRENITLLEAVNTSQQLIIETQKQTISIQQADNRALRDAYEDMIRDANRRKFFGYVVGVLGIAAAIAL